MMKSNHSEENFDQHIVKIIQHRPELIERARSPNSSSFKSNPLFEPLV